MNWNSIIILLIISMISPINTKKKVMLHVMFTYSTAVFWMLILIIVITKEAQLLRRAAKNLEVTRLAYLEV